MEKGKDLLKKTDNLCISCLSRPWRPWLRRLIPYYKQYTRSIKSVNHPNKLLMTTLDLNIVTLETPHLRLVPLTEKYREDIFREFTAEVTRYMNPSPARTIADTDHFIMDSAAKRAARRELVLAITDKQKGEFYGCVGVHELDTSTPELGIWVKKSVHGQGYGREAIQAVKAWADENVDCEYLTYPVSKENAASRALAEGLGGELATEYDTTTPDGRVLHEVEYHIY